MNKQKIPAKSSQKGVVLVEAMIAILIFSMGVLAIVGLQAAMVKNTSDSKFRADASYIAQQRIGAMWADPDNLATYLENNTGIPQLLPNGTRTTTQSGVQYTVTVTWQQPGEVQHNFSTTATITGG
ncbi:MAG: prepilin-type cleavage/methylation domain-containing protein [Gallionella sp.]|nr:prepilin-type cleavage/methylation domain-containing protein [Gallionella sp.]